MSLLDERGDRFMRTRANRGAALAPTTAAEAIARRDLYWLGLHRAGLTCRQIAAQSGYCREAIRLGIERARRRAGGPSPREDAESD